MIKLENGKCSVIIEKLQAKMTFLAHFLPAAHPPTWPSSPSENTWWGLSEPHIRKGIPITETDFCLHQCLLLLSAYWITISLLSWQMHNHKYNLLDFETVSHGLFISFFVSRQDLVVHAFY